MSAWDSYIDSIIAHSADEAGASHCDAACIFSNTDGAKWTSDAHAKNLKLDQNEINAMTRGVRADGQEFYTNGFTMAGVKYQFLRKEGDVFLFKKKDHGTLTVQKSKTAIVMARTPEGSQPGRTNMGVGKVAEYLTKMDM